MKYVHGWLLRISRRKRTRPRKISQESNLSLDYEIYPWSTMKNKTYTSLLRILFVEGGHYLVWFVQLSERSTLNSLYIKKEYY